MATFYMTLNIHMTYILNIPETRIFFVCPKLKLQNTSAPFGTAALKHGTPSPVVSGKCLLEYIKDWVKH